MSENSAYSYAIDVKNHAETVLKRSSSSLNTARKRLFITSLLLIGLYITGATPTKIAPLGITFSGLEIERFLSLFGLIVLYLWLRYIIFSIKFVGARESYRNKLKTLNKIGTPSENYPKTKKTELTKAIDKVNPQIIFFSDLLSIYSPIILGLLAAFIGFFPKSFIWFKLLFGAA